MEGFRKILTMDINSDGGIQDNNTLNVVETSHNNFDKNKFKPNKIKKEKLR